MSPRFVVILLLIGFARSAQAQGSYPMVNQTTQNERDADRRVILEAELRAERVELAKAQASFDAGPNQEREADMRRHIENIKALQRELDGVVGDSQESRMSSLGAVKAVRPAATAHARSNTTPRFWDPYNRAPETTDFSTSP